MKFLRPCLSVLFLLLAVPAHAIIVDDGPSWLLPPILAEGAPIDLLIEDAVLPALEGNVSPNRGTGSVSRSMMNQLPMTLSERGGRPGTLSTFQGLGLSEDNSTMALGIPLNPAQGGGFDLSVFPQYLWSGYRFQLGPSLGSFDPRAAAGTLRLSSWTEDALHSAQSGHEARLMSFYSDAGVTQLSIAGRSGSRVAAVAGYSDGEARGPSMALSGRWGGELVSGRYHLLATRLEANVPGGKTSPTPDATQLTARIIPVLQADFSPIPGGLLKTSVFYDGEYLRYDDPSAGAFRLSSQHSRQFGIENALLWEDLRIGLSARRASFNLTGAAERAETVFNFQISRALEWADLLLEPSVQLVGVSGFGLLPAASFGARKELVMAGVEQGPGEGFAAFTRFTLSRRFPSMLDRYYVFPNFLGNPDLKVERDWTFTVGTERKTRYWENSVQAYGQLREGAQVTMKSGPISAPSNTPLARVYALLHTAAVRPLKWMRVHSGLTLTHSRMSAQGLPLPRLPGVTGLIGIMAQHTAPDPAWDLDLVVRGANSASAPSGAPIAGYGYADLGLRARLLKQGTEESRQAVDVTARVENLFDRPIEFVEDYPTIGRVYSVSMIGHF